MVPDRDLMVMRDRQTLFDITVNVLGSMEVVKRHPDVKVIYPIHRNPPAASAFSELLDDASEYRRMSEIGNPYGDGKASCRIADFLQSLP